MKKISSAIYVGDDLMYKQCPACGTQGQCEQIQVGTDLYRCKACGYEGDMQEDIDAENYFWEEALGSYGEDEKGEVFDKAS